LLRFTFVPLWFHVVLFWQTNNTKEVFSLVWAVLFRKPKVEKKTATRTCCHSSRNVNFTDATPTRRNHSKTNGNPHLDDEFNATPELKQQRSAVGTGQGLCGFAQG
jgi:hypothetical protein